MSGCCEFEECYTKERFKAIVESKIKRPCIKSLMEWLETTDFYTAPASTIYHGAKEGGLLEHTLTVFENLLGLHIYYTERKGLPQIPVESLAIVALFHDLCKIGCYEIVGYKKQGDEYIPKYRGCANIDWSYHGECSVEIAERFIQLTREEKEAIRYHMGAFHDKSCGQVYDINPLAWLLHVADEEAAYLQKG